MFEFQFITDNWEFVGCLVALLVTMAFGMLWYGRDLMGDVWCEAQGLDEKKIAEMHQDGQKAHLTTAVMYVLMIVVVNYLAQQTHCQTVNDALWLGGLLWLGFALPLAVVQHSYNPHGKKVVLLINISFQLIYFLLQAVCIVYFKGVDWKFAGIEWPFGGGDEQQTEAAAEEAVDADAGNAADADVDAGESA